MHLSLESALFIQNTVLVSKTNGVGIDQNVFNKGCSFFEENKGQIKGEDAGDVYYIYRQDNLVIFLCRNKIVYQFEKHEPVCNAQDYLNSVDDSCLRTKIETYRFDLEILNSNTTVVCEGINKRDDYTHYYNSNIEYVYSYEKVLYKNIYANIDLLFYTSPQPNGQLSLKYDFIVRKGGNIEDIQLKSKWLDSIKLGKDGGLVFKTVMGEIKELAPVSYQEIGTKKLEVSSKYSLKNDFIQYHIGDYNEEYPLVIDPELAWSTYYSSSTSFAVGECATDNLGNVYLSGTTNSSLNIAEGGHQNTISISQDCYLVKFSRDGKRLWGTYYGGERPDLASSCSVDIAGNVYLSGNTSSLVNIAYNGYKNTKAPLLGVSFVAKFNSQGIRQWGTYFGYFGMGLCKSVATENGVVITGTYGNYNHSKDTNFAYNGFQNISRGEKDGYIASFDSLGGLRWATYYGGDIEDRINDISADKLGNIYVVGTTNSPNFMGQAGYQNTLNKGIDNSYSDAFISKFSPSGSRLWSSYLGSGYDGDTIYGCSHDVSGNLYVCGRTNDTALMTFGAMTGKNVGFLAKFSAIGQKVWARPYFNTFPYNCVNDSKNNLFVTGSAAYSNSAESLLFNGFSAYTAAKDIFVSRFDTLGQRTWSTYYGGLGQEEGLSIASSVYDDIFIASYIGSNGSGSPYSESLGYNGLYMNRDNTSSIGGLLTKICHNPNLPLINIKSNLTAVCKGTDIVFKAIDSMAGLFPLYFWKMNGKIVGVNSNTLKIQPSSISDTITCSILSSSGCSSFDTVMSNQIIVKLIDSDISHLYDTICEGTRYMFDNKLLDVSGDYQIKYQGASGCDSFVVLHLLVKPKSVYTYNLTTTCQQPSYFFNGQTRTVSGEYIDTLIGRNGCDSLIILNLTVKAPSSYNYSYQLCEGDSVAFGANYITSAGSYQRIIPNTAGCDSTITLNVSILRPIRKDSIVLSCPPYNYKGRNYEITTKILDTLYSYQGCDSIYLTIDAQIKDKPVRRGDIRYEACDSMRIGGRLYRSSFQYIDTIRTKDALKCDSIYQPYYYTIYETPSARFYSRTKDTMLRGNTIKLRANTAAHYLWSTGHKESMLEFKLTEDVQIYLIAWNHELCKDTSYLELWAFDPIILDFPTGFNPMSSYVENRFFRPNYTGKLDAMQFDIFYRLGEKIYSSNNVHDIGWDGSYKNQLAPSGVYTYILEYTSFRSRYIKTGGVMLVR